MQKYKWFDITSNTPELEIAVNGTLKMEKHKWFDRTAYTPELEIAINGALEKNRVKVKNALKNLYIQDSLTVVEKVRALKGVIKKMEIDNMEAANILKAGIAQIL